ncbi:MAG: GHKL domain-containing protein [Acidobacteria bacterium]|nr:GHKL domain-containing protein [Acidobacteriota bacterium]
MIIVWFALNFSGIPLEHMRFSTPPAEVNARLLNVSCVKQDRIGYLWFGSQDGLWRYDGYQLMGFRHDRRDPNSLADNWVKGLAEDPQGNLWIACREGMLSRLDPYRTEFKHYPLQPEGVRIETMIQDKSGQLWLGCERGLSRFDPDTETFHWYEHGHSLPNDALTLSVLEDKQGRIWAGYGGGGVCRVDPDKGCVQHIDFELGDPRFEERQVWCGLQVGEDIWFGTSHGIYILNPETGKTKFTIPDRLHDVNRRVFITRLMRDRNGRVWIGTRHDGVCVYQDGIYSYCAVSPGDKGGLPHPYVRSIIEDRSGIVWIGTLSGGVSKYDVNRPLFQILEQAPDGSGLCGNYCKSISVDHAGKVWFGSNSGISVWDRSENRFLCYVHDEQNPKSLSSNAVRFIVEDVQQRMWIGTFGGGLNVLDNGEIHRLSSEWPEPFLWLDAGYIDEDGHLWLGSVGGLIDYDTSDHTYKTLEFGVAVNGRSRIRSIARGEGDTLYVGCHDGFAVVNRKDGTHTLFQADRDLPDSLSSNTVRAVYVDSRRRVWVGTSSGINLFNDGSFQVFGESEGLANEVVYGILEEPDTGRLWMSTNAGLSRFDPNTEQFINFYADDGLQGSEFNSGASLMSSDGTMFFGGTNGISYFNPQHFEQSTNHPPVAINVVRIMDEVYPIQIGTGEAPHLELSPNENYFAFEFAALDFSNPFRNVYQYRMKGLDNDWSIPSDRHYVNYPDLSPGRYQFEVKAANSEGVWSQSTASIHLNIRPHFYQTAWFALLVFLFSASLIYGRMTALSRQKRALELVVAQRTQSLMDSNVALERSNAALKEAQDQLVHQAHEAGMAEVAIEVVHNIGNVLNGVGITAETLRANLDKSHLHAVRKVCDLLQDHENDLVDFLQHDEKGSKILPYLHRLNEKLGEEKAFTKENLDQMVKAIDMMRETIQMQQDYANRNLAFRETVQIAAIITDMIALQRSKLEQNKIVVSTHFAPIPPLWLQRFKLAHVIANLLVNAIDATLMRGHDEKRIDVAVLEDSGTVVIRIKDNGIGFDLQQKERLFQYGYTTKQRGRGLGLHSCANSMTDIGGTINAFSDGPNQGAVFELRFELEQHLQGDADA